MVTASVVLFNHHLIDFEPLLRSLIASKVNKIYLIDHSDRQVISNSEMDSYISQNVPDDIEIITLRHENNGYGAGHNVAIREAIKEGSKYHLVVNPDVWFGPDVIPSLTKYMDEQEEVGQTLPKVLYPNGDIQRVAKLLPTPMDMFGRLCMPRKLVKTRNDLFELKSLGFSRPFDAPYLSGCFMFFRIASLEKVGLFDENFFMYAEDIDMTRRINQSGYKTIFYPYCFIYHTFSRASRKSLRMFAIHVKNIVLYFNKWGWWNDAARKAMNEKTLAQ